MELKNILAISGLPGLFKLIKPARNGLLLETIDNKKIRSIKNSGFTKLISLDNVAIYSKNNHDPVPIGEIFSRIDEKYNGKIDSELIDKESKAKLFLKSVMPEYDEERVHVSQILKLANWYIILKNYVPEIFRKTNTDAPKL